MPRPAEPPRAFRVVVREAGVYRVPFEQLVAAGFRGSGLPARRIGLTNDGRPVPVHVREGGAGSFGPGDSVEFVGAPPGADGSQLADYASENVYVLGATDDPPLRMIPGRGPKAPTGTAPLPLVRTQRLEKDLILLRLPGEGISELWYWARLTSIDAAPFRIPFDLADLAGTPGGEVSLRLVFRGWSSRVRKPQDEPDHRVVVSLNGGTIATADWDNSDEEKVVDVPALPVASFLRGPNTVELRVPSRASGVGKDPIVDVSVLNRVEITYPVSRRLGASAVHLRVAPGAGPGWVRLLSESASPVVAYGASGLRVEGVPTSSRSGSGAFAFPGLEVESDFWAMRDGEQRLATVEPVRFERLSDPARQADYVIVADPRLASAAEPLAEFHRARGLTVVVVDVRSIWDEFGNGLVKPSALRNFFTVTLESWRKPAPRWALLVGDASWDVKNAEVNDAGYLDAVYNLSHQTNFAKVPSTPYAKGAALNHRNLIPTFSYGSYDGHAASDNYFVAISEIDPTPRLAIGRLPVTEPEEVAAIVAKTIRHVRESGPGPWRQNVLWISDGAGFGRTLSDSLADKLATRGMASTKVYPDLTGASNARHQERIREAIDEGQLLVHFWGHGGRFIWRTAPADFERNEDLFTLADIDRLKPSARLPVVASMTCYSAPFDHPNADSIGEKLLRTPDRGAVAILAASWRNSPNQSMSEAVAEEFTRPGTVGEAMVRAKVRAANTTFTQQYNLLGDPALPLSVPARA
ncbi:MAG: hypothetical protein HY900_29225, partial [Deltaproteobacteria bacterium]|nr:hypothetical protein [Deltaproteobacteria bacterium]